MYVILSRDVPLLKSDFFLRSEFLVGLLLDIFKAARKPYPRRYTCRQELMDFEPESRDLELEVLSFIYQCFIHCMIKLY